MKDVLNSNFVKRIQEFLSDHVTLVSCVMEILGIGREAAYRRLRNEVPFTFYEVSLIAHRLGISLDQIIGNYESKTGIFNLNLVHLDEALKHYCATLQRFKEYLSFMKGDDSASISMVSNSVPYLLYLPFCHIMKFRLCHWLHQTDKFKPVGSLANITIPEPVANLQREIYEGIQEVPDTYMIWDIHLFASFIKEIDYFSKLNYINKNDVLNLKQELSDMLDVTEHVASNGCYPNGNHIYVYLSNLHFETSYTYMEKEGFQVGLLRLYSINSIDTLHPEICRQQKIWIQTLKRYSTLITESGQMQRITFFNQQRKLLDDL